MKNLLELTTFFSLSDVRLFGTFILIFIIDSISNRVVNYNRVCNDHYVGYIMLVDRTILLLCQVNSFVSDWSFIDHLHLAPRENERIRKKEDLEFFALEEREGLLLRWYRYRLVTSAGRFTLHHLIARYRKKRRRATLKDRRPRRRLSVETLRSPIRDVLREEE